MYTDYTANLTAHYISAWTATIAAANLVPDSKLIATAASAYASGADMRSNPAIATVLQILYNASRVS